MKTKCFGSTALTVVSFLLITQQGSLHAAETCPIFNDIERQTEPVPTLQTWQISGAPTGVITVEDPGSIVNIRAGAGTEFELIATAQPSEAIIIVAHSLSRECDNWLRVEFSDERVGWVHSRYVKSDRGFGLFSFKTPIPPARQSRLLGYSHNRPQ